LQHGWVSREARLPFAQEHTLKLHHGWVDGPPIIIIYWLSEKFFLRSFPGF